MESGEETCSCVLDNSTDDSWSIVDMTDIGAALNYGILADPGKPYLLDPLHGTALNEQLLRNYIVYPGCRDGAGADLLYVWSKALKDTNYRMSFSYVMDAILGRFYDEPALDRKFVSEVCLVVFFDQDASVFQPKCTENLLSYLRPYKGHTMRVLLVVSNKVSDSRKFTGAVATVKSTGIFTHVDFCSVECGLEEKLGKKLIPAEFGGMSEFQEMDVWTNKRLQFELFWEECRSDYKRLQFLPAGLKEISNQVLLENRDKSLEEIKCIYREEIIPYNFSQNDKDIHVHGHHILRILEKCDNTRCDVKVMVDATHSLLRIMIELEMYYTVLQDVLEGNLEAHWRWVEFKKDTVELIRSMKEVRSGVDSISEDNVDGSKYNECYSTMQSIKTSFHELTRRQDLLPIKKHGKAELRIHTLEKDIAATFTELGKNNEKMVNTEFVLNVQFDILSWIKEYETILEIPLSGNDDIMGILIDKQDRIKTKLTYCPTDVIEEYFNTCERIGTDFLLASVLAVELSITRLLEKLAKTSQEISRIVRMKATIFRAKASSLFGRTNVLVEKDCDLVLQCSTSLEKVMSLVDVILTTPTIELPEIQDISTLKLLKMTSPNSLKAVYRELAQSLEQLVDDGRAIGHNTRSRRVSNKGRPRTSSPCSDIHDRCNSLRARRSFDALSPYTQQKQTHRSVDTLLVEADAVVCRLEKMIVEREVEKITSENKDQLERRSRKMSHILQEFQDTEKVFIESLTYLRSELIERPLGDEDFVLPAEDRAYLEEASSILKSMLELHTSLHKQVKRAYKVPIKVGQIFCSFNKEFSVYVAFIKLQPSLEQILLAEYFKEVQRMNADPMPADSVLNKPMQRLCKYKLLFEDILSNSTNQVFEVPSLNQALLQSKQLLGTINDFLHLREETFHSTERSTFHLYNKVTLSEKHQPLGERKIYLFQSALYIAKSSSEFSCYELKNVTLLSINKSRLELELQIQPDSGETLKKSSSLRRSRNLTVTLMFREYHELMEWVFRFNNIMGQF